MTIQSILPYLGYLASLTVLVSITMKSIVKLRIINSLGALLFCVYATYTSAWPVLVLNAALIGINVVYLIKMLSIKDVLKLGLIAIDPTELALLDFYSQYRDDITKFFGDINISEINSAFLVISNDQLAGIFAGIKKDSTLDIKIDFVSPVYRDFSIGNALYQANRTLLTSRGFTAVQIYSENKEHSTYLTKMGFTQKDNNNFSLQLV